MTVRRNLIGMAVAIGLTATCWAAAGLDEMAKSIVGATQASDNTSFINDNFVKDVASKLSHPAESDDAEGIDFDIFTYSQDPDYEQIRKTIKSEVKQADEANGVIRVTFTQYGDEIAVEYHLKKSGERWLIDDVIYPNDDFSLRSGLDMKQGRAHQLSLAAAMTTGVILLRGGLAGVAELVGEIAPGCRRG